MKVAVVNTDEGLVADVVLEGISPESVKVVHDLLEGLGLNYQTYTATTLTPRLKVFGITLRKPFVTATVKVRITP